MTVDTTAYTAPYAEFFQQGQEAVRKTVDAWTRTVTTVTEQFPAFGQSVDAEAAIDRYYEFNNKVLEAQRDFAKRLVGQAAAAGAALQQVVDATPAAKAAATATATKATKA
jgi:hypothetical protein